MCELENIRIIVHVVFGIAHFWFDFLQFIFISSVLISVYFFDVLPLFWNCILLTYREAFKHELTLLEKVRHPNVVQFVGAVTQNVPMMIVSEYHPKVSFSSFVHLTRFVPH